MLADKCNITIKSGMALVIKVEKSMIYLDNAATTKPSKAAVDAMIKAAECFGNPSSLHGLGIEAEKLINESKKYCRYAWR